MNQNGANGRSDRLFSQAKIRQTFVAGIFASVPLAVTAFIIWYVDGKTRNFLNWLLPNWPHVPGLGIVLAIALIYVVGMVTTSFLGKFFLSLIDGILMRLPVIRQLYQGWKQIALTPGGTEGTFSKVVLIPDETGYMKFMGFTSARLIEADEPCYCVFVPSAPNPITGRLYFVPIDRCELLDMSPEEAFKVILSTGNYVPPIIRINAVGTREMQAGLAITTMPVLPVESSEL